MNISSPSCASLFKSILCAHSFSGLILQSSADSSQSGQTAINFCEKIWENCANVSVSNSPFETTNSKSTKLTDFWNSKSDFCNVYGGPSAKDAVCFSGEPIELNDTGTPTTSGLCFEKIGNGSYLNMVAHPDGSKRAFFLNQAGNIWLANIPKSGSGGTLELDESTPFLDFTDEVHFDGEFGMMGMAFHPSFTENGRMFVSFNGDKVKWPGCAGRCSCNSDVNCDPSKLVSDNGGQPCQFQSVIAEFTANGTTPPSLAKNASPVEVRRIFTMGLPFTSHHGGQILFGPADGYLYLVMGDGGGVESPENSGNFTTKQIPFSCSSNSPLNCSFTSGNWMGFVFSFSEDNNKDIFTLTSSGVYRVVSPTRCKYMCSKVNTTVDDDPLGPGTFTPPSHAIPLASSPYLYMLILCNVMVNLLMQFF